LVEFGTEAEEALGYQLRTSEIRHGREVKIPLIGLKGLNYAKVDFLIVDGPSHEDREQRRFDREKDTALRQLKY